MAAMKIMTKATYGKKFLQFPRGKSPSLSRQEGGRAGRNSAWGSELRTQLLNSKQKANANWPKKKSLSSLKLTPSDICQPARPNLLKLPNQNHQLVTEYSSDQD